MPSACASFAAASSTARRFSTSRCNAAIRTLNSITCSPCHSSLKPSIVRHRPPALPPRTEPPHNDVLGKSHSHGGVYAYHQRWEYTRIVRAMEDKPSVTFVTLDPRFDLSAW